MQLVSITPKNLWYKMLDQPIIMSLSHLIEKYPEYKDLLKNRSNDQYVMVDNSIIEMGSSFSMERIYNAAKSINANEIILEDSYPNGLNTIKAIDRSLNWLVKNNHLGEFKLQAVCHGRTDAEFLETLKYIKNIKEIDVIGIPKVISLWARDGERKSMARFFTDTDKELHYLGSWNNLKELIDLPRSLRDRIRSCDTCLPAYYAIKNMSVLKDREGTIDLEKEYLELTEESYENKLKEFYLYYDGTQKSL